MSQKSIDVDENNLSDSNILNKYKTAGEIATEVMKKVIEACVPNRSIYELCSYSDSLIIDLTSKVYKKGNLEKGIAFPTCISINNMIQYFSPLPEDSPILHSNQMVKIEFGVHIDGYIVTMAHTIITNPTPDKPILGRMADVYCAAYLAMESTISLLKPNISSSKIQNVMGKMCSAYKCCWLDVDVSQTTTRNILEGDEKISLKKVKAIQSVDVNGNPTLQSQRVDDEVTIQSGQVWQISIIVSTGTSQLKQKENIKPTIYQRNLEKSYNLKLKASRNVFNEISKRFGHFPFSLSALEDKRGRLGIVECLQHNLLHAYPIQHETSSKNEYVAHFKATVLIQPNGNVVRLTGLPFLSFVHSDYGVQGDSELGVLVEKIPLKNSTKKVDVMDMS